ncbi:MAG: radical SAM protein [bacterium]|nr:radical SAM protein [bacterium]
MNLKRVDWEITSKCNLPCVACEYRDASIDEDLTYEEIISVCNQISQMGCKAIKLTGGDIFLMKKWDKILIHLKKLGMSIEIETSGVNVDEGVLKILKTIGIKRLIFRLDSVSERLTLLERGLDHFPQKLIETINLASDYGIISGVITTLSLLSLNELPLIYNLILNSNAKFWELAHIPSHGKIIKLIKIRDLEYYFLGLYISKLRCKTPWDKLAIFGNHSFGYYSKLMPPHSTSGNWVGCRAGNSVIGIRTDGTVEGCIYLNRKYFKTKSLKNYSLKEIVSDSNFCSWNNTFKDCYLSDNCKVCIYADRCKSGCAGSAFESCQKTGANTRCYHYIETLYENINPKNDFEEAMKQIVNGKFKENGDIILQSGSELTSKYIDSLVLSDTQKFLLDLVKND